MSQPRVDAVVIKARIGRRASTEEIDGFKVNIGAIAIEFGGVFEETFHTVGAPLNIRAPEPASSFFLDGKLVDVGRGGWALLLGQLTKQAARILEKFADARSGNLPDGRQSTEDWLKSYTSNATVHAIFRNLCAAIFACNANELPARAFLTYFTGKGAFKRFGFCPEGTIGVWNSLASVIKPRPCQGRPSQKPRFSCSPRIRLTQPISCAGSVFRKIDQVQCSPRAMAGSATFS